MRSRLSFTWTAAAILGLACGGEEAPSLVRLGELLPRQEPERPTLARDLTLAGPPLRMTVNLDAPRVTGLEIHAAGDATLLRVNWMQEGEERVDERRARRIALRPGGEQIYSVELQGHPAWGGRIAALDLAADQGTLEVGEIVAVVPGSPYRDVELDRLLVPAIVGQERMEIALPRSAGRARFETRLGLLPALAGTGATATFRAWIADEGGAVPLFETTISAAKSSAQAGGDAASSAVDRESWRLESRPVELAGRSTLVLTTEVRRQGELLSPQLAFWGNPSLVSERADPGLNLVVLAVDTLRADVVGAYGDETGVTPHIDALASRSIRFADLTAPAPWTLPSFASLLTGLQPQSHGAGRNLTGNIRLRNAPITRLDGGFTTLSRVLSAAGVFTAGFYTNPFLGPAFGLHRHYDEYQGFEPGATAGPVVDRVLETLARVSDRRFFLFVHLLDPHTPYEPPAEDCRNIARALMRRSTGEALGPALRDALPCVVNRSQTRETLKLALRPWAEALYRAEVAYTDRQIGRLLAALDERGLSERTLVLLVSDHGEEFWEHQRQERRLGYHAIADHGHSHYQELLHVPAILFVPGQEPREVSAPVETVDLFPTVLSFLGLEPPPNQGRDLGPLIAGEDLPEPLRMSDFLLYGEERWAARQGPWKLVVKPGESPVVELYDIDRDPAESRDESAGQRGVVAALRRAAEEELAARRELHRLLAASSGGTGEAQLDEAQIENLRALGYLE